MDGFKFFAPSLNSPSISSRATNPTGSSVSSAGRSQNIATGSSTATIRERRRPNPSIQRVLPATPIRNPQVHDLVILASSIEPLAANGLDKAHHAGHINDTVCRYPSTIIGRGATFIAKKIFVPCGHGGGEEREMKARFVVTKTPRITSRAEQAGAGIQRRLRHVLFELRVLSHEPIMFHPNVVRLLGISWEDDLFDVKVKWPSLVLEYADAGTLESALANDRLPRDMALKVCLDVANGLSVLHECCIVHSDVKADNVLLFSTDAKGGSGLTAKIADFGFSIVEHGSGARLPGGTFPWYAPEWRDWIPARNLAKTDVYSFGLLVWRVTTRPSDPVREIVAEATTTTKTHTTGLGTITTASVEIEHIRASTDDRMLEAISANTRNKLGASDARLQSILEVLSSTVRRDVERRSLETARSILARENRDEEPSTSGDDADIRTDTGEMCREVWRFTKSHSPQLTESPQGILTMCGLLTAEAGISHKDLGELRKECRDVIDEHFFDKFCKLASERSKVKGSPGSRRIDEIRVQTMQTGPSELIGMNPDITAFETSRFSPNHTRLLHPDVQNMVYGSLVRAADQGSPDAALFLAIFHVNVRFDADMAAKYILHAADLGSASGMYLCYRLHKALGKEQLIRNLDLTQWLYSGTCWGSQIAYEDDLELNGHSNAAIILRCQGSCNGDTPFREASMQGPFDLVRDTVDQVRAKIQQTGRDVNSITLAGDNGDKLIHWAAAVYQTPFHHQKLLLYLVDELGADVNTRNGKGETPLIVAMRAGNGAALSALLRRGADVSLKSNSGQVALHWLWTLAEFGRPPTLTTDQQVEEHMRVLALGLSGGSRDVLNAVADSVSTRVNGYKDVAHSQSLQTHILSDLPAGTPLHWAVQRRSIACVRGLLAAGADPWACAFGADSEGGSGHGWALSPLHLAAAMHDDDILGMMLERDGPSSSSLSTCRPGALAVAIDGNASQGYSNGRFQRMVRHGRGYQERARKTFQLLWDKGCRTLGYGFDASSWEAAEKAATQPTPLLLAVHSGQADVVKALLATPFGRDLEKRGGVGLHTPLQESIKRRCKDVYLLLKEHGADVHEGLSRRQNPLSLLALVGHADLDVAQDLIQSGIPLRSTTGPNGLPPLAAAISGCFFDLARLFLDHGADPNELLDRRVGIHQFSNIGRPTTILGCLLGAFDSSRLLALNWLLDQHINGSLPQPLSVRVCPSGGLNAFHVLAMCGVHNDDEGVGENGRDNDAIVAAFRVLKAAFPGSEFLDQQMDPDDPAISVAGLGNGLLPSPLLLAVQSNNVALVRELVNSGADPLRELGGHCTPLRAARQWTRDFAKNPPLLPEDKARWGLKVRQEIVNLLEDRVQVSY